MSDTASHCQALAMVFEFFGASTGLALVILVATASLVGVGSEFGNMMRVMMIKPTKTTTAYKTFFCMTLFIVNYSSARLTLLTDLFF